MVSRSRWSMCLAFLSLAVACAGCGGGAPERAQSPAAIGEAAYRARNCYRCHGADRSGTEMGPPLQGLKEHWDTETLAAYIADPAPFRAREPRLRDLVDLYHGRLMKGVRARPEERRALAEWLLAEPRDGR